MTNNTVKNFLIQKSLNSIKEFNESIYNNIFILNLIDNEPDNSMFIEYSISFKIPSFEYLKDEFKNKTSNYFKDNSIIGYVRFEKSEINRYKYLLSYYDSNKNIIAKENCDSDFDTLELSEKYLSIYTKLFKKINHFSEISSMLKNKYINFISGVSFDVEFLKSNDEYDYVFEDNLKKEKLLKILSKLSDRNEKYTYKFTMTISNKYNIEINSDELNFYTIKVSNNKNKFKTIYFGVPLFDRNIFFNTLIESFENAILNNYMFFIEKK